MASTKAAALAEWAEARRLPMLRFDYSGHGLSEGDLLQASIGDWLEEARPFSTVSGSAARSWSGSSMGGWIALLLARKLAQAGALERLAGLVLIAPAWDMTERLMWHRMNAEVRAKIERDGVYYEPSLYGDPYPITKHLIEEGRNHLIGESARWTSICRCASCKACAIPTCPGATRSTLSICWLRRCRDHAHQGWRSPPVAPARSAPPRSVVAALVEQTRRRREPLLRVALSSGIPSVFSSASINSSCVSTGR